MPARRLDNQRAELRLFDVVGCDAESEPNFIRHVALSEVHCDDAVVDVELPVIHMGPPLARTARGVAVQTIGSAWLTVDEQEQIRVYADELFMELKAEKVRRIQQYVILPHFVERSEQIPCRRYSCAGFAIEAYRSAGIHLIVSDAEQLPPIDLPVLERAYPDQSGRLRDEALRKHFGLIGDGPWRVVLAGYVMNSLDRSADEIRKVPYQPSIGDGYFPGAASSRASTSAVE